MLLIELLRILRPHTPSRERRELPKLREAIKNLNFKRRKRKFKLNKIYVYNCGHCTPVTPLLHGKTVTYIFVNTDCINCEDKWIGRI